MSMTDADRRLIEDAYVAQVLILAKSLRTEDSQKAHGPARTVSREPQRSLRRSVLEFSPKGHDRIVSGVDPMRCLDDEFCAFASPDRVAQAHPVKHRYDFEGRVRYRALPIFFGEFFHAAILSHSARAIRMNKFILETKANQHVHNKS